MISDVCINKGMKQIGEKEYAETLQQLFEKKSEKPKLLIANTIKGKGISFSENNNDWHHNIMTRKQYDDALKELNVSK